MKMVACWRGECPDNAACFLFFIYLRSAGNWRFPHQLLNVLQTSGDRNNILRYPAWLELLNSDLKLTVFFHNRKFGIIKVIGKKTSRLLHKNLILGRPIRFFDVIFMSFDDRNFKMVELILVLYVSESLLRFEEM